MRNLCSRFSNNSKDVQPLNPENTRVANMARRIILMFQRYRQNIDPEDKVFLNFVISYLKRNNVSNLDSMPYPELYVHIRNAIREFLERRNEVQGA
jgi:hypothetical protein